ncbi:hypothetical protein [Jannaschia sp. LMIT008]|uniref:hypothetical protein n=1 Tax=Jannaschia maritima TaxID=3032585 RepID=UPI002810CB3B|nr:hypothetical protein [Jannaschia sp. LMIT008]
MAEPSEMEQSLARLEAALSATADALDGPPPEDLTPQLDAARADLSRARDDLEGARARIEALEAEVEGHQREVEEARDRVAADMARPPVAADAEEGTRLRAALEALTASNQQLRDGADGAADASLQAEIDALRAARAMDLAEMRALLAELEPLMESEDA